MEKLEFYNSPLKLIWLFFLTCLLVAAAYFCTTFDEILPQIFGWFGIAFFGLGFLVIPARFLRLRRPEIVIDRRGIEVASWNCGLIGWREIRRVYFTRVHDNSFLTLKLADAEKFYDRLDFFHRRTAKASRALGYGDASISFAGVRPSINEAASFIAQIAPEKL